MEGEQAGGDGVVRKPTASRPGEGGAAGFKAGAQESPMSAMVSGFLADQEGGEEENRSFSHLLAGAINSPTSDDGKAASTESGTSGGGGEELRGSSPAAAGGSFAERLAQRVNKDGGGAAPRPPNPVRFKAMRGGYLTIPPGLSPTTLFDSSPVLLSTSQSEPSPTTGTFPMPPFFNGGLSRPVAKVGEASKEQPFVFKPFVQSGGPRPPLPPSLSAFGGMSQHQAAPALPPAPPLLPQVAVPVTFSDIQPLQARVPVTEPAASQSEQPQQQQPAAAVPVFADRPSEDGYNWRKYGQKQVKGSEYPRSYYKCTHVSCPMKKKVERSHDGQVTEIVYKGDHNHPKPQPTRRLSLSGAHLISDTSGGGFASLVKNEGGYAERDSSDASKGRAGSATGAADPSTSSTSDDEGGAGSKQSTEDGDDDEPDSKRRKKDKKAKEPVPPPRMIREPRVVVQTTSDVDILDDGYRWRKYGQKVVKGNPHPRSYYKCTNLGCPVRKHVERASNDAKAVITTYEGKHNHDVPAARNLGHEVAMQAAAAAAAPVAAPTAKSLQDQGISFGNHRKLEEPSGDVELGMSVGLGPKVQAPPVAATAISLAASINHPSFNDAREPFLHGSGFGARLKQEQPDSSHKII